ncbi:hypothetical protein BX666DRAFT_1973330 [Dichotomocladium elegans]|nr:hypothetical protein BX666DRAFT_1973330 [Dichotomocladium elegans]
MLASCFAPTRTVALSSLRTFATQAPAASVLASKATEPSKKYKVVVVGAGPGGLSVSSTLSNMLGKDQVAIIDPADYHYYQPLWTYVGGGLKPFDESKRPMASLMPKNAEWIKDSVTAFDPENNTVSLRNGQSVGYDYLVVAAGIQINWDQIKGLKESLGKDGVTSNYDPNSVQKTYQFLQEFKGGNAVFTFPNTPLKCPGAPTKIAFLAEEIFRLNGVRDKSNVNYFHSGMRIYGIDHYAKVIEKLVDDRNLNVHLRHDLVEIQPDDHKAIFRNLETNELITQTYDFLHVSPPQGAPTFIKESPLADAAGFVDVNKSTLRHNKYKNVYSIGDCSNLPTGKTAAAIAGSTGVLKANLIADMQGKPAQKEYDGYASCPLVVGRKELILAEFSGYTGQPLETFPFDQRKINNMTQYMNKEIIPYMYWNGLLKGTWNGPSTFRKMMAPFAVQKN